MEENILATWIGCESYIGMFMIAGTQIYTEDSATLLVTTGHMPLPELHHYSTHIIT